MPQVRYRVRPHLTLLALVLFVAGCSGNPTGSEWGAGEPVLVRALGAPQPAAPTGQIAIAIDGSGTVYAMDRHGLHVFGPDGALTHFHLGSADPTWRSAYHHLAWLPDGTLQFVGGQADGWDIRGADGTFLRRVAIDPSAVDPATPGDWGGWPDGAGGAFVLQWATNRVVRLDAGGRQQAVIGDAATADGLSAIVAGTGGDVFVAEATPPRITRYAADGQVRNRFDFTQGASTWWSNGLPILALSPAGNLLVNDGRSRRVEEFAPDGARRRTLTLALDDLNLAGPQVFAVEAAGQFVVAGRDMLLRTRADGTGARRLGDPYPSSPNLFGVSLVGAPEGFSLLSSISWERYDSQGTQLDPASPWNDVRPNLPLVSDRGGRIYAVLTAPERIVRVEPEGGVTPLFSLRWPVAWRYGGLSYVRNLQPDSDGGFFVATGRSPNALAHFDGRGELLAIRPYDLDVAGEPIDLISSGDDRLWWLDTRFRLHTLEADLARETVVSVAGLSAAAGTLQGLRFDGDGSLLAVTSSDSGVRLWRIDRAGRLLGNWPLVGPLGGVPSVSQVAVDGRGHLYLLDSQHVTLLIYDLRAAAAAGRES